MSQRPANFTDADHAAALQAARIAFAPQMQQVMHDIHSLLAERDPHELTGRECWRHLVLRERFRELAAAQAAHAEAHLARLRPKLAA